MASCLLGSNASNREKCVAMVPIENRWRYSGKIVVLNGLSKCTFHHHRMSNVAFTNCAGRSVREEVDSKKRVVKTCVIPTLVLLFLCQSLT